MALDYVETSKKIVDGVGGASNIASATHCMTRLRLILKDESKADDQAVEKIKGVKSVIKQGGQYQVVIGNEVSNLFKEFKKLGNWGENSSEAPKKPEGNVIQRLFGFISGCMTPLLPAMLGTGMVKVILTLLTTFAGLSTESSTYTILYAMGDCMFLFLPIFLSYTIAKKMGGNPALWMVVGAAMVYPDLVTLLGGGSLELNTFLGFNATSFFGIPVICATYTSSVLPILLMAPVMKVVENFAERVSPNVVKAFLKPLLFTLICVPIALIILGPIGNVVGNLLSGVISLMYDACGWLTIGVLSALMPFIIMTGMHYALVPLAVNSMALLGYDVIVTLTMFSSNLAQGGAALGAAVKSKNTETKSEGIASGISAVIAGVTEPAMYGINLRYRKPMLGAVIGAGIAGLFCGLFGVKAYTPGGSPSIFSLVTFIGGDNPMNGLIFGAIAAAISFIVSFIISFILFKDEVEEEEAPQVEDAPSVEISNGNHGDEIIEAPISGKVIPLEEISDETFASGVLGSGFGIIPAEGKVYAPFDGVCVSLFDTLHAMGLKSDTGVELLIHVGLDTVRLEGKPFKAHIKSGDRIQKGQLLLEFDIDAIESAGCKTETPVLVTNADDYASVTMENDRIVVGG
ncbi:MAG: beta-glucoside-specific PTS transporter subunit IIABC [Eubacteriales bacterium]|nr:beta-glucoside-specific PTS transporter subunit IIABC [Eubacteriales bacterium]